MDRTKTMKTKDLRKFRPIRYALLRQKNWFAMWPVQENDVGEDLQLIELTMITQMHNENKATGIYVLTMCSQLNFRKNILDADRRVMTVEDHKTEYVEPNIHTHTTC